MKKLLINIRYWLAPVLILVTLASLILGGMFVWVGIALFGVGIILDTITMPFHPPGAGFDDNGDTMGMPTLQNTVMYVMLPVFALLQVALAWRVMQYVDGTAITTTMLYGMIPMTNGITGLELAVAAASTGIFAGIGIIYGHELSHTKGFSFVISRLMMGLSGSSHFVYAHVYNHHLELAHEDDPATSPRGRSIYRHFWLSHMGQSKFLFRMEQTRLAKLGKAYQTIIVTHSPQVTSKGLHHYLIEKNTVNNMTYSKITELFGNARIEEIARMLSGDTVTVEAREAASKLLSDNVI